MSEGALNPLMKYIKRHCRDSTCMVSVVIPQRVREVSIHMSVIVVGGQKPNIFLEV